jgi:hypothetical protein
MADFNLQGCPDHQTIQLDLAAATADRVAAETRLQAAHIPPTDHANRQAIELELEAANVRVRDLSGKLVDHRQACSLCAALRKTHTGSEYPHVA